MRYLIYSFACILSIGLSMKQPLEFHSDLSASNNYPNTHPIHLSITDIEHNNKDKSLEIIHKVFIDDFEKILESNYKTRLHLATDKENPETDKFIIDYLTKNFVLEIDGKVQKIDFHGKYSNSKEDIFAIWILAKVENIEKLQKVKVQNKVLMDLYDDQDNFVHIKYAGQRKSIRFKESKQEDEVRF
jgi:hypothetical protein